MYKNAIEFWILTLYPATFPSSLIRSSSVLVESVRFPIYRDISSMNNDRFTTPFSIWMPFISSSYLITVAKPSSTMLNKSSEIRHPCVVPDLKGNTFSFRPLSMLAVGFLYMDFIMLRYSPSIPTLLRVFIINGCCTLWNAFSTSIDVIMWFLPFILFMWCITFIDLWILYYPCILRINLTSSWCLIFLMYCWICFANILLRILASMFIKDIGL